jgi:hypothetical protein
MGEKLTKYINILKTKEIKNEEKPKEKIEEIIKIDYCSICDRININIYIYIHCLNCNKCHYKHNIYCNICKKCYNPHSEYDIICHRKLVCI